MLDSKIKKKIIELVYQKPRTVQEIAQSIGKNWRTADSYVEKICEEDGSISARTFREGTRGALKIVFWNNIEKIHSSSFQERLFKAIEAGKTKKDFSPFEIYQYVDEKKRRASVEADKDEKNTNIDEFTNALSSAEKQILFFSGNLSWINLNKKVFPIIKRLVKNRVQIKILTRVDIATVANLDKLFSINEAEGRDAIEIRHCEQPLRAVIVDSKLARMKEVKDPSDYKAGELEKKTFIFYEIYDSEWVEWMQKVFWNLFRTSVPVEKRIKDLKTVRQL